MKKERTIVIKNPLLKHLRNNLRKILIRAIRREVNSLEDERDKYPILTVLLLYIQIKYIFLLV